MSHCMTNVSCEPICVLCPVIFFSIHIIWRELFCCSIIMKGAGKYAGKYAGKHEATFCSLFVTCTSNAIELTFSLAAKTILHVWNFFSLAFGIRFPCTRKREGLVDIGFTMNFTIKTVAPKVVSLTARVKRQCTVEGMISVFDLFLLAQIFTSMALQFYMYIALEHWKLKKIRKLEKFKYTLLCEILVAESENWVIQC